MKIHQQNIEDLRQAFAKAQTKNNFLALLNSAKKVWLGEKAFDFEIKQLNYYTVRQDLQKKYLIFSVRKKSGGERIIHAPARGLKVLQTCLNIILQSVFEPHKAACGFVPKKSIVDNAKIHVGSYYVYNIDLKDFFPSIDQARVWRCLQNPPFSLTKESNRLQIANIIAALCCTEMEVERTNDKGEVERQKRNVLPQGAPTSPIITNIVCQRLDFLLTAVAKRFGLKYSRYADDITFSSLHNVYQRDSKFLNELHRIIADQNFEIKAAKTRLQRQGYRQEVTGLTVNQKVNVASRYIEQIRKWIYLWEKYGYEKAYNIFLTEYVNDKGHVKIAIPNMLNVLAGKLEYLKIVKGSDSSLYISLKERLRVLIESQNLDKYTTSIDLDNVLKLLVTTEDLSKAMSLIK